MKKIIAILLMGTLLVGCGPTQSVTDAITNAIKKCAGNTDCQQQVVDAVKSAIEQLQKTSK